MHSSVIGKKVGKAFLCDRTEKADEAFLCDSIGQRRVARHSSAIGENFGKAFVCNRREKVGEAFLIDRREGWRGIPLR